jgi:hypothetical protein
MTDDAPLSARSDATPTYLVLARFDTSTRDLIGDFIPFHPGLPRTISTETTGDYPRPTHSFRTHDRVEVLELVFRPRPFSFPRRAGLALDFGHVAS